MRRPTFRLRGKLVLSFSLVVAVVTGLLGVAIYATLATDLREAHEDRVRREADTGAALVGALVREREARVLRQALTLAETGGLPREADALGGVAVSLADDPLVAGVVVLDGAGRRLATAGREPADLPADLAPGLHVTEDGGLRLAARIGRAAAEPGAAVGLQVSLDTHALAVAIARARRNPRAGALLYAGGRPLLRVDPDEPAAASRLREALAAAPIDAPGPGATRRVGSVHVAARSIPTLGWTFVFAAPDDPLRRALADLRLRLAAGLGLALLLGVWIVRLVADRISAPLRRLAAAARDTRAFTHGRTFEVSDSADEIGDLARALAALQRDVEASVTKDALTGVFNRSFLLDAFELQLARARRGDHAVACLMLDIDHFKQVNDTHGHRAGDSVLQTVGRVLLRTVRSSDVVARYGGEEFCVLAAPVDEEGARSVAERIREAIQRATTMHAGVFLRCTVSVGVALCEDGGETAEELIGRADAALYASKRGGRNRVTEAPPLPAPPRRDRHPA